MKILLVHNYYGSSAPSGENKVFEAEKAMLESYGHEVEVYTRHSDEIRGDGRVERVETCRLERELLAAKNAKSSKDVGRVGGFRKLWGMIKGALCTIGNPFAARAVAKKCREFKPDVVHFHNTFPLISPLVVRAASKYAPVVMTLHNYRTACAAGVPTRDGRVCSLCLDKKCVWDGIKQRCYRGSLAATLPLAINIALYRRLLPKWVSRFIVLWRGIVTAMKAPDLFSGLMAVGITMLIALQFVFNLAIVTSWFPVTGMPVPFMSYGGSSLLIFMSCVGILLNISRNVRSE